MNTLLPKGITQRQNKDGTVVYRVDTCINGKRIKSPKGTLEYAIKELEKYDGLRKPKQSKNQFTKIENDIKVSELIENFKAVSNKYGENTFPNYLSQIRCWFRGKEDSRLSEVADYISSHKMSRNTMPALCALLKFAKQKKYPLTFDLETMESIATQTVSNKSKVNFLTAKQAAILFKYLEQEQVSDPTLITLKRMIIIALYDGLRVGEVLGLRKKNVDFEKNTLHVCSTKFAAVPNKFKDGTKQGVGKTRVIPMSKHVADVFREIFSENPNMNSEDLFFTYTHGWVCTKIKELHDATFKDVYTGEIVPVLNKEYTFHTFRHTFATLYFKCFGADSDKVLYRLMLHLGHSSLDMVLKYVHLYETYNNKDLLENLTFTDSNKIEAHEKKEHKEKLNQILKPQTQVSSSVDVSSIDHLLASGFTHEQIVVMITNNKKSS